ncbi:MAG: molybdopterin-dependent oxidoreductase, partial [Armatimonadetes bacterium]|nr:molybdopterin-dependent oxidoreductase [Armatimonadota bacterium]
MDERHESDLMIEPERYELLEGPMYRFEMTRRDLMKTLGGGILILFALENVQAQDRPRETRQESRQSGESGRRVRGGNMPQEIGAWLHINEKGEVTVFTGKAEVGQDIRTSLSQSVAEELRVPMGTIHLVMGDTDLTPFDPGTFGSRTTPIMNPQLRKAAAAARELLLDLAAERWKADRAQLKVVDGRILHPENNQTLTYEELSKGEKLVTAIGDDAPLTPPGDWTLIGKPVNKVNGRAVVTGRHDYTADMKLPGMLYGEILRADRFNSDLVSLDSSKAEAMPGVKVVREGNFVGVAAPDAHTARAAVRALKAEWKVESQVAGKDLYTHLKKSAQLPAEDPELKRRLESADHTQTSTYEVAYIAHAPLEPRAAVAEWKDGKLTVWTGTQRPFGVRGDLSEAFKIPAERVRVIMPDTGSGYGGKHTGEAALEAARLAKAAGKPVKLVWSREEEFTHAYFRPAGVIDVRSGVTKDGTLAAWDFHNYNSGGSSLQTPYEVAYKREEFHRSETPLRQGSYRGLASTANCFARETHMDELARALKMDPLEFRLKNLKNDRLRAAFEAAAKGFGWGKATPAKNHGYGIAGGVEKGGYVATCAEIAVDPATDQVKVV